MSKFIAYGEQTMIIMGLGDSEEDAYNDAVDQVGAGPFEVSFFTAPCKDELYKEVLDVGGADIDWDLGIDGIARLNRARMYYAYLEDWLLGTGDCPEVAIANAVDAALHDEGLIGIGRECRYKTVYALRCALKVTESIEEVETQ